MSAWCIRDISNDRSAKRPPKMVWQQKVIPPWANIPMTKVICYQQTNPPILVDICLGLVSYINHWLPSQALATGNEPLLALINNPERSSTMVLTLRRNACYGNNHHSPWLTILDQCRPASPGWEPQHLQPAAVPCVSPGQISPGTNAERSARSRLVGWFVGSLFPRLEVSPMHVGSKNLCREMEPS